MITVIGLRTDSTICHFIREAPQHGVTPRFIDIFDVVDGRWKVEVPPSGCSWVENPGGVRAHLDVNDAYYCRLIDLSVVDPLRLVRWRTVIQALSAWLELCPGVVVNRPGHAADNATKPLHESLLSTAGLQSPPSFTGSRHVDLLSFVESGPTVAKALSGQRVDCRLVTADDLKEYDERSGPVHLQRWVPGFDVRAHVVGDRVLAVRVLSQDVDYRVSTTVSFEEVTLSSSIEQALVAASLEAGLDFAGWDLRVDGDQHWVLEANPMPGYNYYDRRINGRITRALIDHLREERQRWPRLC